MRRIVLFFVLAVAASPAAAAPKTVTLPGDYATCSRIEVLAQFIDTRRGFMEWAERFDAEV